MLLRDNRAFEPSTHLIKRSCQLYPRPPSNQARRGTALEANNSQARQENPVAPREIDEDLGNLRGHKATPDLGCFAGLAFSRCLCRNHSLSNSHGLKRHCENKAKAEDSAVTYALKRRH